MGRLPPLTRIQPIDLNQLTQWNPQWQLNTSLRRLPPHLDLRNDMSSLGNNFYAYKENQNHSRQFMPRYEENGNQGEKSFIDTFDNNTENLLNHNKSFARNIQGRLLGNPVDL